MALTIQQQLAGLQKKLQDKIEDAMKNEVAEAVIKEGRIQVNKMVYNYKPKQYKRTYKLRDESWDKKSIDNGVVVRNIREDENTGKYIPEVIETGEGYDYTGYGYEYEEPRPFIESTRENLSRSKNHVIALKSGLKKRGVRVK